jgi:uncharacterized Zn finger protein
VKCPRCGEDKIFYAEVEGTCTKCGNKYVVSVNTHIHPNFAQNPSPEECQKCGEEVAIKVLKKTSVDCISESTVGHQTLIRCSNCGYLVRNNVG